MIPDHCSRKRKNLIYRPKHLKVIPFEGQITARIHVQDFGSLGVSQVFKDFS